MLMRPSTCLLLGGTRWLCRSGGTAPVPVDDSAVETIDPDGEMGQIAMAFEEEDRKMRRLTDVAKFVRKTPEFQAYKAEVDSTLHTVHRKHYFENPAVKSLTAEIVAACEQECTDRVNAIDAAHFDDSTAKVTIGDSVAAGADDGGLGDLHGRLDSLVDGTAKMVVAHQVPAGSIEYGMLIGNAADELVVAVGEDMRRSHGPTNWWPEQDSRPHDWPEGAAFTPTIAEHFRRQALETVASRVADTVGTLSLDQVGNVPALPERIESLSSDNASAVIDARSALKRYFAAYGDMAHPLQGQLAAEPLPLEEDPDVYDVFVDDELLSDLMSESLAVIFNLLEAHGDTLETDDFSYAIDETVNVFLSAHHKRRTTDLSLQEAERLRSFVWAMMTTNLTQDETDLEA